jgi:hypothetical protein
MPKVSKEKMRSVREQSERLKERARELIDKARNTAQVTAFRRDIARIEAKKKK